MTDEESEHDDLDQATLQMLTQENLISSNKHAQVEYLNMQKARMAPPHFCH